MDKVELKFVKLVKSETKICQDKKQQTYQFLTTKIVAKLRWTRYQR